MSNLERKTGKKIVRTNYIPPNWIHTAYHKISYLPEIPFVDPGISGTGRCLSRKDRDGLETNLLRLLIGVRTGDDGTYKSFTTISPWNWKNGDGGELSNKTLVPFPEFVSDTEESWEERNSRSALGSLPTFSEIKSSLPMCSSSAVQPTVFSVIKDSMSVISLRSKESWKEPEFECGSSSGMGKLCVGRVSLSSDLRDWLFSTQTSFSPTFFVTVSNCIRLGIWTLCESENSKEVFWAKDRAWWSFEVSSFFFVLWIFAYIGISCIFDRIICNCLSILLRCPVGDIPTLRSTLSFISAQSLTLLKPNSRKFKRYCSRLMLIRKSLISTFTSLTEDIVVASSLGKVLRSSAMQYTLGGCASVVGVPLTSLKNAVFSAVNALCA